MKCDEEFPWIFTCGMGETEFESAWLGEGIVPAVRWSDYGLARRWGSDFRSRAQRGRTQWRTASIYLLNAERQIWHENSWLTGRGSMYCIRCDAL